MRSHKACEPLPAHRMKRKVGPKRRAVPALSSKESIERFLSVKGKKRRTPVDWKSISDDEYKVPGR